MKIKNLLQKYVINNILYKILAAVFAFILWLVILNLTDPEYSHTFYNIPVTIQNEQLVLDGTNVYTIASGESTSITVTGKRSIISSLSVRDFVVSANFAELSITNAVPIKVSLTGAKARYSNEITIILKDTSMIINLEEMTSKQIPVEIQYLGESDGLVIDEANLSPKKLEISAPKSVTDSAVKAVVTADYGNIEDGSVLTLTPVVVDEDGNMIPMEGNASIDIEEISAEFKASYSKQIPLSVSAKGTPKAACQFKGVELSQDTITVKGTKDVIVDLTGINITDAIDITGAEESFDTEIDVTPYLPEGATVYGESPIVIVTAKIIKPEYSVKDKEAAENDASEKETTTEKEENVAEEKETTK